MLRKFSSDSLHSSLFTLILQGDGAKANRHIPFVRREVNMSEKIKVLAVAGPTASGKTALGVVLAKLLGGEVVSCDSMQIYKGMKIGTAAPDEEERDGVPHHMIGVVDPRVNYSAADYARDAGAVIEEISGRGKLPVLVGGTGLYLDALLKIRSFSDAAEDPKLREKLREIAERDGAEKLHGMLREKDPEAAEAIHPNNVKRVVRALEVILVTGRRKSELDREALTGEGRYDADVAVIDFASRETLYDRIGKRVDIMLERGLRDEVESLLVAGMLPDGSTAAQAIGYREMIAHLRGETTLDEAAELIKKNTRNYAKRQMTWFRRYDAIRVTPDRDGGIVPPDVLAREIADRL